MTDKLFYFVELIWYITLVVHSFLYRRYFSVNIKWKKKPVEHKINFICFVASCTVRSANDCWKWNQVHFPFKKHQKVFCSMLIASLSFSLQLPHLLQFCQWVHNLFSTNLDTVGVYMPNKSYQFFCTKFFSQTLSMYTYIFA